MISVGLLLMLPSLSSSSLAAETIFPEELIRGLLEPYGDAQLVYYELVAFTPGRVKGGSEDPLEGLHSSKKQRPTIAGFEYRRKRVLGSAELRSLWRQTLTDARIYQRNRCQRTGQRVVCQQMSACFYPGAAVEFVKDGQNVTFVICLGCGQIKILGDGIDTMVDLSGARSRICSAEKQSGGRCVD